MFSINLFVGSFSLISVAWWCIYGLFCHWKGLTWKESMFFVGFVVLSSDFIWLVFSILRWFSFYPFFPDILQLIIGLIRNLCGMFAFSLFIPKVFKDKVEFTSRTKISYSITMFFFLFWFSFATDPSWLDWVQAWEQGLGHWWITFTFSHIIGRLILFYVFSSWFKPKKIVIEDPD